MSWLDSLDDEYVRCRKLGHQWDEIGWQRLNTGRAGDARVDGLVIRCVRCGATRYDAYDKVGWLQGRRYAYEPGYIKPTLVDRPAGNEWVNALRARGKKQPKAMRSPVLEDMAERMKRKDKEQ